MPELNDEYQDYLDNVLKIHEYSDEEIEDILRSHMAHMPQFVEDDYDDVPY